MDRFLIGHTGAEPPEHVRAVAGDFAVEFAPLAAGDDDLERRLSELRPDGYLVNDPGWNPPFLSAEAIEAASNLRLVTYMGATLVPEDYAPYFDLDALRRRQIVLTSTTGTTISVAEERLHSCWRSISGSCRRTQRERRAVRSRLKRGRRSTAACSGSSAWGRSAAGLRA